MTRRRAPLPTAAALAAALALGACSGPPTTNTSDDSPLTTEIDPGPVVDPESLPEPTTTDTPVTCDDPTASYAPGANALDPTSWDDGSLLAEIRDRGTLRVGVSADTVNLSSRDPLSGEIIGFDVDVLSWIAEEVVGDADALDFTVLEAGERAEALRSGRVDLVARAYTITCSRWEEVSFSVEYLLAGQRLLVAEGSGIEDLADLAGQRVCAAAGTTTIARLEDAPGVEAVPASTHTSCLVQFQQRTVDAISADDTILAGLAAQDPYAEVAGPPMSEEPYGVAAPSGEIELVRVVNAVIADRIDDGTWNAAYERWFAALGAPPTPPVPDYGREP